MEALIWIALVCGGTYWMGWDRFERWRDAFWEFVWGLCYLLGAIIGATFLYYLVKDMSPSEIIIMLLVTLIFSRTL